MLREKSNSKDFEILKKLRGGDRSAFKELFDLYYRPLSLHAFKYCDSKELAEDIVQELFIKFWNEQLFLKMKGTLGPYLYKSVKNNTLNATRKKSNIRFDEIENQVNQILDDEPIEFESTRNKEKQLLEAVEQLPEKCKEVFKAIVFENLKYKEVSTELNVSVNTVKTQYSRALKKLRTSLGTFFILFFI